MKTKPLTRTQIKELNKKRDALSAYLWSASPPFNPESLARSYGLTVAEVERMLKEFQ